MVSEKENIIKVERSEKVAENSSKPGKKKRKIIRKILIAFFLILITFFIFIQTSFFKNWLLQYGVNKVNEVLVEKDSRLFIEKVEGSVFKDLSFFNISLTVQKDTMFKLNKIELGYDLSGLFNKTVKVKNLFLENPQINFTKLKDKNGILIWNIDYLLISDKTDTDTTKSEFDWKIYADNVEIVNGSFRSLEIKDSDIPIRNLNMKKMSYLTFSALDVVELNLKLNASYLPDEKNVNIQKLSFKTNSAFNLQNLSMQVNIDKDDFAEVKDLYLKTDKSNVNIKVASLENLNPLKNKIDYFDFQKKNFNVDIITDKFDFDDLTYFLPDINFMNGAVFLNLRAKGNYSNFKVDELYLTLPHGTTLDINGRVKNLHDPAKLYFDVDCKNAILNPKDGDEITPGLPIPDYSHLGIVNASFKFIGEPLKFNAEAVVKSSAGDAEVKGFLDITQNELVYDAKASTNNLNIGKIIKDDKLKSSITGDFIAAGRGVDYKTMVNKITYNIKNTSFYNQRIESSSGTINANSGKIDFDLDYKSNSGFAKLDGNIFVRDINNLVYNVKGNVAGFDISSFSSNESDKSNLNFNFDVQGAGTDIDNLSGKLNMQLQESKLSSYIIPSTPLSAEFSKNDTARFVKIDSDLIDLNASGRFKFMEIPEIVIRNIDRINEQITKNLMMDTLGFYREPSIADFRIRSYVNDSYTTDLRYNLKIKSLLPLNLLMKDSSLVFKCDIRGRLLNNENSMVFSVSGRFEDFKYGDTTMMFKRSVVRVFLKNDYDSNLPFTYLSDINLRFNSLYTGSVNFDTIGVDFQTSSAKPIVTVYTKIDSSKSFYTKGYADLSQNNYGINFDTMSLNYDAYSLSNSEPVVFNYMIDDTGASKNHIDVSSFKLTDGNQRLNISGIYSFNGESDITVSADKINIAKLQKYFSPDIDKNNLISGNVRRIMLNYKGSFEDPHLNLEANTDFLSAQKMKLGRVDALVEYGDNILKPLVAFYNPNNSGILTVDGFMPYENPLLKSNDTDSSSILFSPVNLNIKSKDFQIKILQQFVPVISDLRGKMNGNIDISGILKSPELIGDMSVKNGSFNLDMTGVNYDFNALLSADKQKLNFTDFKIKHKSSKNKIMNMGGYIDFSNLTFNDMELRLSGEAKLLDENVTQNIMGIYGNLYGKTGTDIVLKGNADNLYMTGELIVDDGRLLIVPQYKVAYNIYSDNFIYKVLLDSNLLKTDTGYVVRYIDSLSSYDKSKLDPFDSYFKRMADTSVQKPKPSNFKYYIKVKTLKDIYTKLIIEEKSGQEFTGNVSANITFDNLETESFSTRGRIDLGDNSYYKFYKSFAAKGYALFTGDVVNPEMYIKGNYSTTSSDPNNNNLTRNVEINLDVKGRALNPILKWEILSNGSPIGGNDPTDDAISFIVFGRFKDELNADQRLSMLSSVGANVGTNFVSNYVSDIINTYLPFILKTDISYKDSQSGSFAENTDIRVTAQLAGATIILGGQILRDLSNTNFLIEYPLNRIFGINNVSQNLIIQLERYIDPFSQNNTFSIDNRTGGSLFYRIKF